MYQKWFLFFLLLFGSTSILFASSKESVIRVQSNALMYDYKQPWKVAKSKVQYGSGVIIKDNYILTAAHVVNNAQSINISKHNSKVNYKASIKYISYQADLALLELQDENFFKNTTPLNLSANIFINKPIQVAGYAMGSKRKSLHKGKVEHIKYRPYALSNENLLALELKANIKEGMSGGAVLNKKGELIGLAIQIAKGHQSIAYAVPAFIINTFLNDTKDGKIDGFHSNANSYQYIQNKSLQHFYNINEPAILVNAIDAQEKQLQTNDVILKINAKKVPSYNAAQLALVDFFSQFHTKTVGEIIQLEVLRNGKIITLNYRLNNLPQLLEQEFEQKPRYYVLGGLVFTPLTRNYLQSLGMKQYEMNMLFYGKQADENLQEQVVWIEDKFVHEINFGLHSKVEIVQKINGIRVKNFSHFIALIENSREEEIIIDFVKKQRIVLNKREAIQNLEVIKKTYKLRNINPNGNL